MLHKVLACACALDAKYRKMAKKYSFKCCKCSSFTCNCYDCWFSPGENNLNQNNYWYGPLWYPYLWWSNQQTFHQDDFPTWCSTCVEEQKQREKRKKWWEKTRRGEGKFLSEERNEKMQWCENDHLTSTSRPYSDHPISNNEESSGDDFEMELNSEFKRFLEQSAKHKEQRKKEAELNQLETDDYVEAGEIVLEVTTVAPTQQQGVVRTEEMKVLYGKSARHIESLETSLQLHFNMNVDMRHPVFWPSIPLKF